MVPKAAEYYIFYTEKMGCVQDQKRDQKVPGLSLLMKINKIYL